MSLPGVTQSSRDLVRTEKLVEKNLREINKALVMMKKHYNRIKTPRITAHMGFVSAKIFMNAPEAQNIPYFSMPAEIQDIVWANLVHQPDRIAFALTCKWNAQRHEELRKLYKKVGIRSPRKEHRLAVLLRLEPWARQKRRLCFTCVRYLPRRSGETWGGDTKMLEADTTRGHVSKEAVIRGPKCPDCKYRDEIDLLSHTHVVKEFKNVLKSQFGSLHE